APVRCAAVSSALTTPDNARAIDALSVACGRAARAPYGANLAFSSKPNGIQDFGVGFPTDKGWISTAVLNKNTVAGPIGTGLRNRRANMRIPRICLAILTTVVV